MLASLNHPNIAHVYGFESATLDDGRKAHFLAMELVAGEDLAERLERGPIPIDDGIAIARQIAEGLEEAHEKGIVHRDLKPANVKLTPDGAVQSFPVPGAKARVSTSGGGRPIWRRDGREVLFRGAEGGLFEADLRLGSGAVGVATAATRRFFTVPGEPFATKHRRSYDVSADGQRFLLNLIVPDEMPRGLTVIVNGTSEEGH